MGNAELVLDDANSSDTETYLSEIVQAATLGSDLTRSLLSFARKSHLRPVVIEMNAAIMGMETLLRRALPESVAVRTALAEGLWQVEADRSELERALLNLALNARDAMPNGGKLTVETANVTFPDDDITGRHDAVAPGRYVMLAVSDTGTGIAPEILDRVFEPFFTTKGPDKGTGLGLPMVQGFAQQSGGAVRIYSEPGKGVSVKVYLHAVAGRASARAARPKRIPGPSTGCVLVVEDNDAVRVSVTRSLKAAGYSVVAAPSGDAALALLDDTCTGFDIVLTDVVMPGQLQGPDLVHQIRARRPDMPVVFMSGYPHEANVHGNGIRKNDISLMKPVGRAELLFALEKALRKK
jgi:CheY-like chemotaxis protein